MFKIATGALCCRVFIVLLLAIGLGACRPDIKESASPEASTSPKATSPKAAGEAIETPLTEFGIKNARTPLPGVLTGGQPSPEQIERVAAEGYRTVVNLRTPDEEGGWDEAPKVEELGMRYLSIPVAGAAGITLDNSRKLFEVLENHENYPVMVHCGSGNRIGALFALHAFHVDGKDAESALMVGREAGLTKLEETVRGLLEGDGGAPGSGSESG